MSVSVVLLKFPTIIEFSYVLSNNIAHPMMSFSVVLLEFPTVTELSSVLENNIGHPIIFFFFVFNNFFSSKYNTRLTKITINN